MSFYVVVQKVMPRKFVKSLGEKIKYAGMELDEERYAGLYQVDYN